MFRKWDGTNFTRSNFVEESERFRDVNGDPLPDGEHPTISWNRSPAQHAHIIMMIMRL